MELKVIDVVVALTLYLESPTPVAGRVIYKEGWSDARIAKALGASAGFVSQTRVKYFGRVTGPVKVLTPEHMLAFQKGANRARERRATGRTEDAPSSRRATPIAADDQTPTALASLRRRVASLEQVAADRATIFSDICSRLSFLERELGVVPAPAPKPIEQP